MNWTRHDAGWMTARSVLSAIFRQFFFAVPFFVVAVVFAVVCPFTLRYGTQLLCFSPVRLALFSFFFFFCIYAARFSD